MIDRFVTKEWAPVALLLVVLLTASVSIAGQVQSKSAPPAGDISGRITIGGQPASGLFVELMPNRESYIKDPAIAKTSTDTGGSFEFNDVAPGFYWVKVDAPGFVTEHWDMEGPGRRVTVGSGAIVHGVDIALLLGGVVSGRIQDQDGKPVAGERVQLRRLRTLH